jgi:hypothetical protein
MMAGAVEEALRLPRIRSLIVLRDGETLAEHRCNGGPPLDQAVNVKSASKSVISALVGIAIDRGVLSGVTSRFSQCCAATRRQTPTRGWTG